MCALAAAGAAGTIVTGHGPVRRRFFATEKFLAVSHLLGAVLVSSWRVHDSRPSSARSSGVIYRRRSRAPTRSASTTCPTRPRPGALRGTISWIVAGVLVTSGARSHSPAGLTGVAWAAWNHGRADAFTLSAAQVALGPSLTLPRRRGSNPERERVHRGALLRVPPAAAAALRARSR
jgi:hypothetical protein